MCILSYFCQIWQLQLIDYGKFKLKAKLSRCPQSRSMHCFIVGNFNISLAEVCLGLAKELWIRIMPDPGVLVRSESVLLKRPDPYFQKGLDTNPDPI